ncbi:hypothetical protein GBF35_45605 [Nonomuraea phyllanthi]|uniref:hypothetical protein n=1 Tax=Nonomuraea phyllanthi TaxID=2219224 RepID=UPI0012932F96|nr:hypothetical protein [Nonomuraea phyllanthi]QFY12879.1 hypothetical protein GBF35_45605 [Nonomuraea phyllanthi]
MEVDDYSLTGAARHLQEPVDLLGQHTETLLSSVAGGSRSAWGIGLIGAVMDQLNERLGQACAHVHTNLADTGASIREMRERSRNTEVAIEHVIEQAIPWR